MENYLIREVVYMVVTFKLLPKKKCKKKDFKWKIPHNFKKKLTSIFYHLSCTISQLLNRIIVLYYKPLVVLWYTF